MYKVHGIINNKKILETRMNHLPRVGDLIRIDSDSFYRVTETVWCLDEYISSGPGLERVNLRLEEA